jgi:hypothetical protein
VAVSSGAVVVVVTVPGDSVVTVTSMGSVVEVAEEPMSSVVTVVVVGSAVVDDVTAGAGAEVAGVPTPSASTC